MTPLRRGTKRVLAPDVRGGPTLTKARTLAQSKRSCRPFHPDLRIPYTRVFTGNPLEGMMQANTRIW